MFMNSRLKKSLVYCGCSIFVNLYIKGSQRFSNSQRVAHNCIIPLQQLTINKCNICFNWVLKVWMTRIMLSLFTDNVKNTLLHIYPSLSSLVWLHTSMRTGGGGRGAIYIFSWHRFIWMFCFFQIFFMSQINKKDMNYWFDQGFHT